MLRQERAEATGKEENREQQQQAKTHFLELPEPAQHFLQTDDGDGAKHRTPDHADPANQYHAELQHDLEEVELIGHDRADDGRKEPARGPRVDCASRSS